MAIPCDLGDPAEPHPGDFVISRQDNGDTVSACAADACRMFLDLARGVLPAEEIAATLGPLFVEGGAAGSGERPKRRREKTAAEAEPEPPPESAAGGEEEAAAANDG